MREFDESESGGIAASIRHCPPFLRQHSGRTEVRRKRVRRTIVSAALLADPRRCSPGSGFVDRDGEPITRSTVLLGSTLCRRIVRQGSPNGVRRLQILQTFMTGHRGLAKSRKRPCPDA